MKTLFAHISNIFRKIELRQVLAAFCASVLLLTTGAAEANAAEANLSLSADANTGLNRVIQKGETGRPRTTGQWQAENEALQGEPLNQLERISTEAADAVGEMAEIYPQNARTLTPGMDNGALPKDD